MVPLAPEKRFSRTQDAERREGEWTRRFRRAARSIQHLSPSSSSICIASRPRAPSRSTDPPTTRPCTSARADCCSPLRTIPGDQLGSILVETDRITQEQLDDVNSKVGPGNPLAKLLSESGVVSQRELAEAARSKVEKILSDVVSYETGSFEFEDGVLPKGAVDLKLATERVAMAAVCRIEDREFVLRHLGGLDVVLIQTSEDVTDESAILALQLDGQRSLKEAASLASMEEFDAAKVACAMLFLGWAEVRGDEPAAVGPEPEPGVQLDFDGASEADLDLQETRDPDETVMLGTPAVPHIDTAATMAEGEQGAWPGAIAGEEESPAAEPALPGAEAEAEPEPATEEPEPTQAWPTALSDDEESPGSDSESAWPNGLAGGEKARRSSLPGLPPTRWERAEPSRRTRTWQRSTPCSARSRTGRGLWFRSGRSRRPTGSHSSLDRGAARLARPVAPRRVEAAASSGS